MLVSNFILTLFCLGSPLADTDGKSILNLAELIQIQEQEMLFRTLLFARDIRTRVDDIVQRNVSESYGVRCRHFTHPA